LFASAIFFVANINTLTKQEKHITSSLSSTPSKTTPTEEIDLDTSDREILLFVMKGCRSSYAIWSAMKKATEKKGLERKLMTYRNNNKRVIRLARLGLIEEMKPDMHTVNIHGRKDYKVTEKGMEQLAPYILTHPEDVKEFIQEYMYKNPSNKHKLGQILMDNFESALQSIIKNMESMKESLDFNPSPSSGPYIPATRNLAQIERISSQINTLVMMLRDDHWALETRSERVRSKSNSSLPAAKLHNNNIRPVSSQKKKH
jgi:hypothetical protein